MSSDWKEAYDQLNKKYVQKCAEIEAERKRFEDTLTEMKSDLAKALYTISQYQGIYAVSEVDQESWDEVPFWIQEIVMNVPWIDRKSMGEKWSIK